MLFSTMAPTLTLPSLRLPDSSRFDLLPCLHSLLHRLTLDPIDKDALSHKDIVTEAAAVKMKIQNAGTKIDEILDIERAIGDQEREILALERKVRRQRTMLQYLAQQTCSSR